MELIVEVKIWDLRERACNFHVVHAFGFDKNEALAFARSDVRCRLDRQFETLVDVKTLEVLSC